MCKKLRTEKRVIVKDNSKMSKQIINYILNDGDFKMLTTKQKSVISNSLPKIMFDMTRSKNLKGNSTLKDDYGDTHKISYNTTYTYFGVNNAYFTIKNWWLYFW